MRQDSDAGGGAATGPPGTAPELDQSVNELVSVGRILPRLVLIDTDTTVRRFPDELRRSQPYHTLALGF